MIDVIFKMLNFGLLVFVLWYVSKNYGIPYFRKMFNAYKKQKKALNDEYSDIDHEIASTKHSIKKQNDFFKMMNQKFDQWKSAVESQKSKTLAEQEECRKHLESVQTVKNNYIMQRKFLKEQGPQVVDEITADCLKTFESKEEGKEFIDSILKGLGK